MEGEAKRKTERDLFLISLCSVSYALNVIPSSAEAGFDIRIPPTVPLDEMERLIRFQSVVVLVLKDVNFLSKSDLGAIRTRFPFSLSRRCPSTTSRPCPGRGGTRFKRFLRRSSVFLFVESCFCKTLQDLKIEVVPEVFPAGSSIETFSVLFCFHSRLFRNGFAIFAGCRNSGFRLFAHVWNPDSAARQRRATARRNLSQRHRCL